MLHKIKEFRWTLAWSFIGLLFFAVFTHRAWIMHGTDYVAYYNAGTRALQGTPLYFHEQTPFKYLPVVSYLFIPFTFLPFAFSKLLFFFVSFASGVWIYRSIQRQMGRSGNWIALAVLFCMFRFHNYDFLNCQVNHLLLLLLVLYLKLRDSRPILASFLFSVLASFKIVPLLILAPLFFMKRFKELGWIIAWFLALNAIPLLTFEGGIHLYTGWFNFLRETTEFPAPSGAILQSVQSALWYWIGPLLANTNQFSILSYATQFILLGVCCVFGMRSKTKEDERRVLLASIILSIIISPLAWKHNYLLMLPSFVVLLKNRQYRAVGAAFFLMSLYAAVVGGFSMHWVDRSYSLLIGALVVFFSILLGPRAKKRAQQPGTTS